MECEAAPNDGKDDTAAVLSAIEECRGRKSPKILFRRGRYDFFAGANPRNPKTLFEVEDLHDLTIDGQGSEFIIHGATSVFSFARCKNLTVKNVTIDWERTPFSQGRVLDVADKHFDVEVCEEYPVAGNETIRTIREHDPKTGNLAKNGWFTFWTIEKTELLRPQVLRIHLKDKPKIRPGMIAVMMHYYYDYCAFWLNRCSDTRVENLTLYTAPGMGFNTTVCINLTFEKVQIVARPGTGRLVSTCADGLHLSGSKGTVTIKDCRFDRTGDDAINFKCGLFLAAKSKPDDRTVVAYHGVHSDPPDPGDVVEFSHPEDLVPYATAVVKSAQLLADHGHKLELAKPLPAGFREGDMIANASRVARGRITNCGFTNIGRGILVQSRDVIAENCSFRNIGNVPIWVASEICNFNESIQPADVVIRKNLFTNDHYGPNMCAIGVFAYLKGYKYPLKPGIHRNITVEENTFRGLDNCAVLAAGVDGLVIKGNVVRQIARHPTDTRQNAAFYVRGSRNIQIEGNSVDPASQGKRFKSALQFGAGCDKDTTVIRHNEGF